MKMEEQEAIIFDLGVVIINLSYQLTQEAFLALGLENFDEIYSQLAQQSLFDNYETGKIGSQHFINELLRVAPKTISANKIVAAWNAMILNVPVEKIQLLDQLRTKKRVFLLSNTNDLHMEKVRREWSLVSPAPMSYFFEKIYLSHEIGMRKPNAEIFEFVCSQEGLNPIKTLFIDDTLQHIEGAKSIGLNTVHLKNSEDLYQLFS
ncbi:MAG: HAD family phosphatase [Bacteroidota bacterium]